MWTLGGLNAFIGGLCAAEMGALLPASGGDYAFFLAAGKPYGEYGDVPAFLFAWTLFFMDPATTTIQGLTFSAYVLSLPYPHCAPPYEVKVLVTCLFITFATAVNCFSVKTSTKVQDVLSGLKCAFLYAVIVTGVIYSFHGNHIWDSQPSGNVAPSTGDLASAMYSALYCYGGWNAINCVAEEVKNPGRNIPIAIAVSVVITVIIYLLTNLAFFVVLDTDTIANADAVAVTFVRATWGQGMAHVMPLVIGLTVFGTTCANVVTSSRIFFAASRQGHLARVMSYVHVDSSVPLIAMVVRCLLSLAFTLVGSVHFLIEVSILLGNVLDAASVASLLLLRRSMSRRPKTLPSAHHRRCIKTHRVPCSGRHDTRPSAAVRIPVRIGGHRVCDGCCLLLPLCEEEVSTSCVREAWRCFCRSASNRLRALMNLTGSMSLLWNGSSSSVCLM
ncbi:hypothetical protein MTO96_048884 [Rhipicephalus appendiculatus]